MTKRAIILITIRATLVVLAYAKNPAQGQANLSDLLEWVWPL